MNTITITQEQYDTFDNALAAMEREIRKLRRELRALKPDPAKEAAPTSGTEDPGERIATIWHSMYSAYRIPANPEVPTVTQFGDGTLTVTVEARHLRWFNDHRFHLQKMLCERLPDPVTLVFEAATSDPGETLTEAPTQDPPPDAGESAQPHPNSEGDEPAPEPSEVAGVLQGEIETLTAKLRAHGISEIVNLSENLGGFCLVVDKKFEELALKFPGGRVRVNSRYNGRTELYIMGISKPEPPAKEHNPALFLTAPLTAQSGEGAS